ncbi:MAG: quinolinate synthase NadA [Patescibacteria group bacterium]|nr:quinolinate synthase NadA [Patescibacteria group bacterium]
MNPRPSLPSHYVQMDARELGQRIKARKAELGGRLCILGHHYQRDEIVEHADLVGDSLRLSQAAAEQTAAEFIVFCGVHFMAESAAILARPGQTVILPNLRAGCPMAAMARAASVGAAMEEVAMLAGERVTPVIYVNSTAEAKAVAGASGGACCTSANAASVFRWALDPAGGGAKKILMLPDEHLGRNTAVALGYGNDACAIYDPALPDGGLGRDDVARAVFLLWKGHCYVHQQFTLEHVLAVRRHHEDVTVMVHPECAREVVAAADRAGSTEQIIRAVAESPAGARWAIGTESHLVNRLAKRHPEQDIQCLSAGNPVCLQMQQIDLPHLLWVLDAVASGSPLNVVTVTEDIKDHARLSLRRMLACTADTPRAT